MRSPGVIYRKYRQLKRKYLYEMMAAAWKKKHENCAYGKTIEYTDIDGVDKKINLCTYNCEVCTWNGPYPQPLPNLERTVKGIDVCVCPGECSAFAPKWDKDQIKVKFEEILNTQDLKHEYFPELEAYEWVLDKSLEDSKSSPTFLGKIIVICIKVLEDVLKFISGPKKELG